MKNEKQHCAQGYWGTTSAGSRAWDKGGEGGEGEGGLQKNIFLPFGPQFGLR